MGGRSTGVEVGEGVDGAAIEDGDEEEAEERRGKGERRKLLDAEERGGKVLFVPQSGVE